MIYRVTHKHLFVMTPIPAEGDAQDTADQMTRIRTKTQLLK